MAGAGYYGAITGPDAFEAYLTYAPGFAGMPGCAQSIFTGIVDNGQLCPNVYSAAASIYGSCICAKEPSAILSTLSAEVGSQCPAASVSVFSTISSVFINFCSMAGVNLIVPVSSTASPTTSQSSAGPDSTPPVSSASPGVSMSSTLATATSNPASAQTSTGFSGASGVTTAGSTGYSSGVLAGAIVASVVGSLILGFIIGWFVSKRGRPHKASGPVQRHERAEQTNSPLQTLSWIQSQDRADSSTYAGEMTSRPDQPGRMSTLTSNRGGGGGTYHGIGTQVDHNMYN